MLAVYTDKGISVVQDYPAPTVPSGWALIRVLYAGICRTDLEIVKGYADFQGVPGHEFSGEIVETGEVIATVGDSGAISGPSLYFEIRYQGTPVDPLEWINNS